MDGLAQLLPFVLIAVVFWFLLIRPQRKRQLAQLATQRGVGVGDEVMLGAGIVGRVAEASDEFLQLEVSPGVRLKVARAAVSRVMAAEETRNGTTTQPPEDPTGDTGRDYRE